ncbi:MAG: VacJ family lipoprotein [Pseudomonadales bacterium]|nr:VacJ family lipoprotein [Pseudomonadales bacterium]
MPFFPVGPAGNAKSICITFMLCTLLCYSAPGMASEQDPLESFNRKVFVFNEFIDRWALKPLAKAYRWITPGFVDRGVSNFFDNLAEVRNLVNAGLQGDLARMGSASGRLLVNSSVGIGGLFDVASGVGISARDEDFGQTLGVWGVGSGPYIVLPLFGGSSLRDAFALAPDIYLSPSTYLDDEGARYAIRAVDVIDLRADLLDAEALVSGDRYTFLREVYLQRRQSDIHNGELNEDFDNFDDDF